MIWEREGLVLSDEPVDQDAEAIYALLTDTYWAKERTKDEVKKIIAHSLCFSLKDKGELIAFVRIISDYTKMSWVSDMIVREEYRGRQLGYWMMQKVMNHPELKGTQFALQTKDAHSFYEKLGFAQRSTLMSTSATYL